MMITYPISYKQTFILLQTQKVSIFQNRNKSNKHLYVSILDGSSARFCYKPLI